MDMTLFQDLIEVINEFTPEEPFVNESELELKLLIFLTEHKFSIIRQKVEKKDRYDLICKKDKEIVCIEMKLKTSIKDVSQFDKYLPKFKDGLIVVCWQATFSISSIFAQVIKQSSIPMA